jgi:hypothetical protein
LTWYRTETRLALETCVGLERLPRPRRELERAVVVKEGVQERKRRFSERTRIGGRWQWSETDVAESLALGHSRVVGQCEKSAWTLAAWTKMMGKEGEPNILTAGTACGTSRQQQAASPKQVVTQTLS